MRKLRPNDIPKHKLASATKTLEGSAESVMRSPFKNEKARINQAALGACEYILGISHQKVLRHYSLNETNPHCLQTPIVLVEQSSAGELVGQISLYKPMNEGFDSDLSVCEVALGVALDDAPWSAVGRRLDHGWEFTPEGKSKYVVWLGGEKTDHIDIRQAERDYGYANQRTVTENARLILGSMTETIQIIKDGAKSHHT